MYIVHNHIHSKVLLGEPQLLDISPDNQADKTQINEKNIINVKYQPTSVLIPSATTNHLLHHAQLTCHLLHRGCHGKNIRSQNYSFGAL